MATIFETVKQCVVKKNNTDSTKIYTNYNSKHRDQTVTFNRGSNSTDNYIKSGGSIVAFIFCILFVNSFLGYF